MNPNRQSATVLGRAFSLVELLVVTAVIGILAGLLVPQLPRARFNAKVSVCLNQYRHLRVQTAPPPTTAEGAGWTS